MASAGCATTRLLSAPPAQARSLDAIFEEYFEAYLKLFPIFASEIGALPLTILEAKMNRWIDSQRALKPNRAPSMS